MNPFTCFQALQMVFTWVEVFAVEFCWGLMACYGSGRCCQLDCCRLYDCVCCWLQVDVFSFGVIIYELLVRQVTSAVVSQAGDMTMPEMYAQKVSANLHRPLCLMLPFDTSCQATVC